MAQKNFAIEVRKTDAIDKLFDEVDSILKINGVLPESTSEQVQNMSVAHSLHRMINEFNYFMYDLVQRCAATCHLTISAEREKIYKSAHCMDWNAMTPEYRKVLVAMLLDDFRTVFKK